MSISGTIESPRVCGYTETGEVSGKDGLFLSNSRAMARIHEHIERFATVNVPVLLLGESGVGKEVYARRIHQLSPRGHRTFLKVNCAALPSELLESELFGYEAGAFTGAVRSKPGMFELCNKGTILLDEIGELPPALQAKLLQVLQDHQFCRLGGRSMITVDVRILAATNIDIRRALSTKAFREDLYYRLSAFAIHLPPLRERRDDIVPLLQHFMQREGLRMGIVPRQLSSRLIDVCLQYPWPGNARELENFVKRFLVLDDEDVALAELSTDSEIGGDGFDGGAARQSRIENCTDLKGLIRGLKAETEKEAIRIALERSDGNRTEAARLLNISTKALLQKVRQYGVGADSASNLETFLAGLGGTLPSGESNF